MWAARSWTRWAIAPGKRWMAGRSRKAGSRSAEASVAASREPRRSRSASGPEKAFWTETCWSSAKPTSSAIGSEAISVFASSESVKYRRSGTRTILIGVTSLHGTEARITRLVGGAGAGRDGTGRARVRTGRHAVDHRGGRRRRLVPQPGNCALERRHRRPRQHDRVRGGDAADQGHARRDRALPGDVHRGRDPHRRGA